MRKASGTQDSGFRIQDSGFKKKEFSQTKILFRDISFDIFNFRMTMFILMNAD